MSDSTGTRIGDQHAAEDSRVLRIIELPGNLDEAIRFVRDSRGELRRELLKHAGLLFRGLQVQSADDVEAIALVLEPNLRATNPLDDTPRPWFSRHVYGAQEDPPPILIPLHQEDSYLPRIPTAILFACLEAPSVGGETIVVDCRTVFQELPMELRERLERTRVRVQKRFEFTSLALTTGGATHEEIERLFREYGGAEQVEFDEEAAIVTSTIPAVIRHPETQEQILFGRLHLSWAGFLAHYHYGLEFMGQPALEPAAISHWADLMSIAPEVIEHYIRYEPNLSPAEAVALNRIMWANAAAVRWRPGDILYVDNRIAAHGRLPYQGRRSVVVCSTEPELVY